MGSECGSTRDSGCDSLWRMSKTFRPWNIDQQCVLPRSVVEFVPVGHVAHFVRGTVRTGLDLSAILSSYGEDRGYPPYDPTMMTALLVYAYSQGIYSSRQIARACEERLDFMAGTALHRPAFRTGSDFPQASSEGLVRTVHAGAEAVCQGRLGEARARGGGRHEDQGECVQAQGDELRPD